MKKFLLLVLFPLTSFSQVDLSVDSIFHRQSVNGHIQEGLDYYQYTTYSTAPLYFSAHVSNWMSAATNVQLHLEVLKDGVFEAEFYSDSVNICGSCTDSLFIDTTYFPNGEASYDFIYTILSDSTETNTINNVDTFSLDVTNNWQMPVRRDDGNVTDSISDIPGFVGSPSMFGNIYEFEQYYMFNWIEAHIVPDTNFIDELIYATVFKYDTTANEWQYVNQTSDYQISDWDITNNGGVIELTIWPCVNYYPGDIFWIAVGHYGGTNPPKFYQAQEASKNSVLMLATTDFDSIPNQKAIMAYPKTDCWGGLDAVSMHESLNLFPNPATNQTSIQFDIAQPSSAQISIIDMQGKLIFEKTLNNLNAGQHIETINTEKIAPGIYNVFVQMDERVASGRLITEH